MWFREKDYDSFRTDRYYHTSEKPNISDSHIELEADLCVTIMRGMSEVFVDVSLPSMVTLAREVTDNKNMGLNDRHQAIYFIFLDPYYTE